jgi:hypothetical protein
VTKLHANKSSVNPLIPVITINISTESKTIKTEHKTLGGLFYKFPKFHWFLFTIFFPHLMKDLFDFGKFWMATVIRIFRFSILLTWNLLIKKICWGKSGFNEMGTFTKNLISLNCFFDAFSFLLLDSLISFDLRLFSHLV